MSAARPAAWLLTPLVAVSGTSAGVLALFFGQSGLAPVLRGGPGAICRAPDCALGVGLLLMAGGVLVVCASVLTSVVVGLRGGRTEPATAVRRGALVCLYCLLCYLVGSMLLWVLV